MHRLFVVGMGPGSPEHMTPAGLKALEAADVLCGYTVYLDLLGDRYPEKERIGTTMTEELARCRMAVEKAAEGKTVALLCSGDAGVYGMAGPVLQLVEKTGVEVEVIPGITAALSGAAVLGAPLMNDFCDVSLSDLLTPWEKIEKRLRCAAEADFVTVLYNPRSHGRPDHLKKACGILLEFRAPDTVCGWVRRIGREGQESRILSLSELQDAELDMFCTVFIGNSSTRNVGGRMVTPRGYEA